MKKLRIKQTKSGIGYPARQKRTLIALGLKRMHQTVELDATPQIIGMVKKIGHLLTVEEI
ncbi:MAG: 50S ribosomal protein L30 [Bacteroidales bacterium]|nr:50S ribosomal protein L30 [Bacteroidales bacterium]MDZ4204441.1 50S ribosomal protein L30 [Bacteroidales bacterium]